MSSFSKKKFFKEFFLFAHQVKEIIVDKYIFLCFSIVYKIMFVKNYFYSVNHIFIAAIL